MSSVYAVISKVKPGNHKEEKNTVLYGLNKFSDSFS